MAHPISFFTLWAIHHLCVHRQVRHQLCPFCPPKGQPHHPSAPEAPPSPSPGFPGTNSPAKSIAGGCRIFADPQPPETFLAAKPHREGARRGTAASPEIFARGLPASGQKTPSPATNTMPANRAAEGISQNNQSGGDTTAPDPPGPKSIWPRRGTGRRAPGTMEAALSKLRGQGRARDALKMILGRRLASPTNGDAQHPPSTDPTFGTGVWPGTLGCSAPARPPIAGIDTDSVIPLDERPSSPLILSDGPAGLTGCQLRLHRARHGCEGFHLARITKAARTA